MRPLPLPRPAASVFLPRPGARAALQHPLALEGPAKCPPASGHGDFSGQGNHSLPATATPSRWCSCPRLSCRPQPLEGVSSTPNSGGRSSSPPAARGCRGLQLPPPSNGGERELKTSQRGPLAPPVEQRLSPLPILRHRRRRSSCARVATGNSSAGRRERDARFPEPGARAPRRSCPPAQTQPIAGPLLTQLGRQL